MDEMCQDLGMPGVLKNAGRPFRSVEAFHNRWRAKIIVRLVERDRYGADRHKKSLNLGNSHKNSATKNINPKQEVLT